MDMYYNILQQNHHIQLWLNHWSTRPAIFSRQELVRSWQQDLASVQAGIGSNLVQVAGCMVIDA